MNTKPLIKLIKKAERRPLRPNPRSTSVDGPNRWSTAVHSWVNEFQRDRPRRIPSRLRQSVQGRTPIAGSASLEPLLGTMEKSKADGSSRICSTTVGGEDCQIHETVVGE